MSSHNQNGHVASVVLQSMGLLQAKSAALSLLSAATARTFVLPLWVDIPIILLTVSRVNSLVRATNSEGQGESQKAEQTLRNLGRIALFVSAANTLYQLPHRPANSIAQFVAFGVGTLATHKIIPPRANRYLLRCCSYTMTANLLLWSGWVPRIFTTASLLLPHILSRFHTEIPPAKRWDGEPIGRPYHGSLSQTDLRGDTQYFWVSAITERQKSPPVEVAYLLFLAQKRSEIAQERLRWFTGLTEIPWERLQLALREELGLPTPTLESNNARKLTSKDILKLTSKDIERLKEQFLSSRLIEDWTEDFLETADQTEVKCFLKKHQDVEVDWPLSPEETRLFAVCAGALTSMDRDPLI